MALLFLTFFDGGQLQAATANFKEATCVQALRTDTFNVVVEPDEDRWHAYCPALHEKGAATWGRTREEAQRNIEEVVRLVMESMVENGERLPDSLRGEVEVT